MNRIVIKSIDGSTNDLDIQVSDRETLFIVKDGRPYQVHFDCLDAIGIETTKQVYAVRDSSNGNLILLCNYSEEE